MTIRPIMFSAPMVRALLEGRKTQTRRVAKFVLSNEPGNFVCENGGGGMIGLTEADVPIHAPDYAPYAPGDLLYVREAFRETDGGAVFDAAGGCIDFVDPEILYRASERGTYGKWKPSIHMPRWASRLTLAVTDVRVQRLQDISDKDAMAEGVATVPAAWDIGVANMDSKCCPERIAFRVLWNSLHGTGAWDQNPWVVAVTFTVHKCNVDHFASVRTKGAA